MFIAFMKNRTKYRGSFGALWLLPAILMAEDSATLPALEKRVSKTAAESTAEIKTGNQKQEVSAAVSRMLDTYMKYCRNDGAITMDAGGQRVWINPYFANLSGIVAIKALAKNPDHRNKNAIMEGIRNWLVWFSEHQNADGSIYDYTGTADVYASTGKYDSTDSYASTFIYLAYLYCSTTGNRSDIATFRKPVLKALDAIVMTWDSDNLTVNMPNGHAKYLMDNIEVNQGLQAGRKFFMMSGDKTLADKCAKLQRENARALPKYWQNDKQYYAWAFDAGKKVVVHVSFKVFYPDILANLFAAGLMAETPDLLWPKMKNSYPKMLEDNTSLFTVAAALQSGDTDFAVKYKAMKADKINTMKDPSAQLLNAFTCYMAILCDDGDLWLKIDKAESN